MIIYSRDQRSKSLYNLSLKTSIWSDMASFYFFKYQLFIWPTDLYIKKAVVFSKKKKLILSQSHVDQDISTYFPLCIYICKIFYICFLISWRQQTFIKFFINWINFCETTMNQTQKHRYKTYVIQFLSNGPLLTK